jgi:hypothetical protein
MDIIRSMKTDYTLADEGDMLAYLDIQVDCKETSAGLEFHLTQPALIIWIIASVPWKDHQLNATPANHILYKGGKPWKTNFHYYSAIHQLNYLTAPTQSNPNSYYHGGGDDSPDFAKRTNFRELKASLEIPHYGPPKPPWAIRSHNYAKIGKVCSTEERGDLFIVHVWVLTNLCLFYHVVRK